MSTPSAEHFRSRARPKRTGIDDIVDMMAEQMRELEALETEKVRYLRQRDEERQRWKREKTEFLDFKKKMEDDFEGLVDAFLEHKQKLEVQLQTERDEVDKEKELARMRLAEAKETAQKQVEEEKAEASRRVKEYREQCEQMMAEEKNNMDSRLAELRAECARLELAKLKTEESMGAEKELMAQELRKEMERFDKQCQQLALEKQDTERTMEKFRSDFEQQSKEQRARMEREGAEFEAKCAKMAEDHQAELARQSQEFENERRQLEKDKQDMERKMADFHEECQQLMAEEEAEMSNRSEQLRQEHEQQLEANAKELERRMADEQEQAKIEMMHFREVCEREMAEEKEETARRMANLASDCERLQEEKEEKLQELREEITAQHDRLLREKVEMQEKADAFKAECEQQMQAKELEIQRTIDEIRGQADAQVAQEQAKAELRLQQLRQQSEEQFQAECRRLEEEHKGAIDTFTQMRSQMIEEKTQMEQQTMQLHRECSLKNDENEALKKRSQAFLEERNRLEQEKAAMLQEMEDFRIESKQKMQAEETEMKQRMAALRADFERKLASEQAQLREDFEQQMAQEQEATEKKTAEFFADCQRRIAENEAATARKAEEFEAERRRLAEEKAEMIGQMDLFRIECERKIAAEERDMHRKTAEFRAQCEEEVALETSAAERRLEEVRKNTEEQLRTEREVTENVKIVLRELPPLQAAMELGDLAHLEEELWKWRSEVLPDRFGECKAVVEAVVKLAKERLFTWRAVDHQWKDILKEVETLPGSLQTLTQQCQRLFRALKEAQLTKMDLRRSDPGALDKACEVLLAWQARAMSYSNQLHERIVRKVVHWPQLGSFDFPDLDLCLRLVDRRESDSHVFLSRALALVEDENTAPKDLKSLLSHLETMLFFLKYAKSEDLQQTHAEFKRQVPRLEPTVVQLLQSAEKDYPPGGELVRFTADRDLFNGTDVRTVLNELRTPKAVLSAHARAALGTPRGADGLGLFREIFYQWALAMQSKFNLLVLPHHTQVVCLLAMRRFLEMGLGQEQTSARQGAAASHIRALIAQVGTGEGKSMIVAALAIYIAVAMGKKVHVVVDDETLLERDFTTFKLLFDSFEVPILDGMGKTRTKRPLSAVLCVSDERISAASAAAGASGSAPPWLVARIDPEADICYCEAKHVQSSYASIARSEKRDFSHYQNRVLILDEVDALVIDEEPNEAFVYPNQELSRMASSIAESLKQGMTPQEVRASLDHPAAARVVGVMHKEWEKGRKMASGEDFVFVKELGKYMLLQSGRVNPKAWSLALECRNFQDNFSREILFQERLFVMSRPRVFRKYYRILGLSGSIGSQPERKFLQETYRAAFFEVPPFLKTCKGAPFNEAVPAAMGRLRHAVYVELSAEAQLARIAEVAFEARERVPVLIIAKERTQADQLVLYLHEAARTRGLGRAADDMVRSLSRTCYESDPEQWKENLNRSTMPMGEGEVGAGGKKFWRVTVTDPRGGRGTDYRVDDTDVDANGGLLLVPTMVPSSQRDWIQFLGRTARQDRKGQYCAVLCDTDYTAMRAKYGGALATGNIDTIKVILDWGDREIASRIQASAALYNNGVRMNEICEEIFGNRPEMLQDPAAREMLVDTCQRHRWMSCREVDQAFTRLPGFDPAKIPTEAKDMGRPAQPPSGAVAPGAFKPGGPGGAASPAVPGGQSGTGVADVPRVVIFCLDWSASMMSRDTKTPLTRFELCVKSVQQILHAQVRDTDFVGVVCFGPQVATIVPPTPKGVGSTLLRTKIAGLRPQAAGGTHFFDAISECLQLLGKPGISSPEASRWLICLTDGDDLGSRRENAQGQLVNRALEAGVASNLNMVMITVGTIKRDMLQTIGSWTDKVKARGGHGQLLSEKDAGNITMAFQVVAECLAAEVGGAEEI